MQLTCSVCDGPNSVPISVIVRSNSWSSTQTGGSVGVSNSGLVFSDYSGQVHGMTALARLLLPPQLPVDLRTSNLPEDWPFFKKVMVVGINCGVLCLVFSVLPMMRGGGGPMFLLVLGLVCLGVGLLAIVPVTSRNRRVARELPAARVVLARRLEIWQRLRYCPDCDRVFDPETGNYSGPEGAHYLWK